MIKINKNWFIDSDGRQYILFKKVKRTNKKTGEEYEGQSDMSYHSTVSDALTCFMRNMQRKFVNKNDVDLCEAIEKFKKIEKFVIETIGGKSI